MNSTFHKTSLLYIFLIMVSCSKKEVSNYNSNANDLVRQVVMDENCDCILEDLDPIIEIAIDKNLIKDKTTLDSINKQQEFILDTVALKKQNVRRYKSKILLTAIRSGNLDFLKNCRHGVVGVSKPLFSKDFKTGVIQINHDFTCFISTKIYKKENGKWISN